MQHPAVVQHVPDPGDRVVACVVPHVPKACSQQTRHVRNHERVGYLLHESVLALVRQQPRDAEGRRWEDTAHLEELKGETHNTE